MREAKDGVRIELCLVSHTNVGKTSLARTLLGRDIGEVRDAAHVTQTAQAHSLLVTDEGDELVLWDTPGLGDSARLYRRLRAYANPIGWFLSQVWDRWTDRTFFLSQQAMRTARDSADIVLYLVNTTESPGDAGYLAAELELVGWMHKPVLALLNQTGGPVEADRQDAELRQWKQHLRGDTTVREVLLLDAFTRCWIHEQAFFDAVGHCVDEDRRDGYRRLQQAWHRRNTERFRSSMDVIATQLIEATRAQQQLQPDDKGSFLKSLPLNGLRSGGERDAGRTALEAQVEKGRARTTRELLQLHGLQGKAEHPFLKRLDRSDFVSKAPVDPVRAGLGGAVASGAATGLAADMAAGGLTLGAGALVGALSGALAFAVGAEGVNRVRGVREPTVRLSDLALRRLVQDALLKYLAIAHFGRGQGDYEKGDLPGTWRVRAGELVDAEAGSLEALFARLRDGEAEESVRPQLRKLACRLAFAFLEWLYPEADVRRVEREL